VAQMYASLTHPQTVATMGLLIAGARVYRSLPLTRTRTSVWITFAVPMSMLCELLEPPQASGVVQGGEVGARRSHK